MLAGVIITLLVLGVVAIVLWAQHVTQENEKLQAEKDAAEKAEQAEQDKLAKVNVNLPS